MKILTGAVVALMMMSAPALSADLGFEVNSFGNAFLQAGSASGTDIRLGQPQCAISGTPSCLMQYGSTSILVEGSDAETGLAETITIKSSMTTPLHQIFETLEFTAGVLRPDISPLQARRMALRVFENLVVTEGAAYSDDVDGFIVETSEQEGNVFIMIKAFDL